jgi:hypothetical protein
MTWTKEQMDRASEAVRNTPLLPPCKTAEEVRQRCRELNPAH